MQVRYQTQTVHVRNFAVRVGDIAAYGEWLPENFVVEALDVDNETITVSCNNETKTLSASEFCADTAVPKNQENNSDFCLPRWAVEFGHGVVVEVCYHDWTASWYFNGRNI